MCPLVQGKRHRTSSLVLQKLYRKRSGVGDGVLQKQNGDTSWSLSIDQIYEASKHTRKTQTLLGLCWKSDDLREPDLIPRTSQDPRGLEWEQRLDTTRPRVSWPPGWPEKVESILMGRTHAVFKWENTKVIGVYCMLLSSFICLTCYLLLHEK